MTVYTFWRFLAIYPTSTMSYVLECTNCKYPTFSSFPRLTFQHPATSFQISLNISENFRLKFSRDSIDTHIVKSCEEDDYGNCNGFGSYVNDNGFDSCNSDDVKKRRKRKRKPHGNKGRTPWNKGIKHSPETRARIKQRTLEAIRDPQVRKKMTEHARPHSDEVKKKIGSALRRIWDRRLKWKRLREKFFQSWTQSIAEAAKRGGIDQQELDWGSYEKIKEDITLQQLWHSMDEVKIKELAKIKADRAAQAKAERMARLAQKRKEREARLERKRKSRKRSKKGADRQLTVQKKKLRKRLKKIRKKKSKSSGVIIQEEVLISHSPAWKKLDMELMNREKVQRTVSLADQIQAAKNKRAKSASWEALTETSSQPFLIGALLE